MAVSNAIGSNVFDILLCLGLPWFIKTAIVDPGSTVKVRNKAVSQSRLCFGASLNKELGIQTFCTDIQYRCYGTDILYKHSVQTYCTNLRNMHKYIDRHE